MTNALESIAIPVGFRAVRDARGLLVVHERYANAFTAAGFGASTTPSLATSSLSGRAPLRELSTRDATFLVRRFSHGGLLRFATGKRFRDPTRPFAELALALFLAQHGVRTPEVVAARAQRLALGAFALDLVTRRVEGAVDLGYVLAAARRGEVRAPALRDIVRALGALVARLHALGFLHADLTPNNVLVNQPALEGALPELWILDLDRAQRVERVSNEARRANLRRLYRFVERREARDGRGLTRADHVRFLRGYDARHGVWKADWRAIQSAHERQGPWHALGWMLETWSGHERDVRER